MPSNHPDTTMEQTHLNTTLAIARAQLSQAQENAEGKRSELVEVKKEVRENTSHSMTNLYGSEDFEALVELSQSLNPVTEIIADYEEEQRKIARLEKLIESPYFARIDFRFEEEEEAEKIYIGRTSLTEKKTREIYIYDWRSPIASVFYRFMTGKAFYEVPSGRIQGEVELKRQYEIKKGILEYFFDTDRNISDELLRQLLSENASPKMKAIVETIQGEQDVVIRDMTNDLLMVQGVAGSGKTSIALHRAAYLMYQGLQSRLSAGNILIVSPNTAFEQYISDVLPELGEENAATAVFEDILRAILRDKRIQPKNEFLEQMVTNNRRKHIVKNSIELKTSEEFRRILDQLLLEIPLRFLELQDIYYKGKCIISKQAQQAWVQKRPETPLGLRLEQLEDYILELIFGSLRRREQAEERNRIRQEIQQVTRFDTAEMYQKIFCDRRYLEALKRTGKRPETIEEICACTRRNLESGRLFFDDAVAIAYLSLQIHGTGKYRNIKQVVIDEAQDYYPLQYEIFRLLFPKAKFTILGDINQTLGKQEDVSFYKRVENILNRKSSSLITLNKSFRCTSEILQFSLQFIDHRPEINSFNRQGNQPRVAIAENFQELLEHIVQEVNLCREQGFQSICLLCKTGRNAERFYEALQSKVELSFIQDRNAASLQGTFLMPVYLSKGLEFDAVLICDADAENYREEDDRKLLYVECTRALHRLSLFCEGEISPYIRRKS